MHRHLFALFLALGLAVSATGALAGTPDGRTPAQEDVCNPLSGAAYGTCNAYCEAQDCDMHARPSCVALRKKFKKLTGTAVFPCDRLPCGCATGPTCGGTCPVGQECTTLTVTEGPHCACKPLLIGLQAPGR
jgi:hypothetical protein